MNSKDVAAPKWEVVDSSKCESNFVENYECGDGAEIDLSICDNPDIFSNVAM